MLDDIEDSDDIAIIGLACRFPKSNTPEEFWSHLINNEELIQKVGQDNKENNYIASKAYIEGFEYFDADLFKVSPREAKFIDPQQRILLECAWECFESACYNPEINNIKTGVFVGGNTSHYFLQHLLPQIKSQQLSGQDEMLILVNNANDYLASRLAYTFNLTGPCISLQSACSTSLLAIYQACQALLSYQCDQTLAGGVSITLPNHQGYHYTPDSIYSPDGHCRPFDHKASGTVFGDGGALILLKRYSDALRDKDPIHAVIKAVTANNDGNEKANYFTPSKSGQSSVISEAISFADVPVESIGYIETHGTGTQIGDPIEINALKNAFSRFTEKKQFCAIGSVKSNIGHLNSAAGIAGLFKTIFCVKNKIIPATLHYKKENQYLDLENSPFYVVSDKNKQWEPQGKALAGLSSFGIGGTNVHLILQEEKSVSKTSIEKEHAYFFPLSGASKLALKEVAKQLIKRIQGYDINLSELSYSLQVGRKGLQYRSSIVAADKIDLVRQLTDFSEVLPNEKKITWIFPQIIPDANFCSQKLLETTPLLIENWRKIKKKLPEKVIESTPTTTLFQTTIALSLISMGIVPEEVLVGHNSNEFINLLTHLELFFKEATQLLKVTKPLEESNSINKTEAGIVFDKKFINSMINLSNPFLDLLSRSWNDGHNLNFNILYGENHPQKVSLPTYPFQRKKFWIELTVPETPPLIGPEIAEQSCCAENEIESQVLSFFEQSLELDKIDSSLDLFTLGGDSLIALEIADKVRNEFDIEVSLENLYSNFTVKGVSEYIASRLELPVE